MSATPDSGCARDEELAAYIDGRLDVEVRRRLELHAVDCDDCRSAISEAVLTLSTHRPRPQIGRYVPAGIAAAAAAAVLLFAVRPADLFRGDERPVRSTSTVPSEDAARFAALGPANAAVLPRGELTFRWEHTAPGSVYRLTLSDERGAVVWSERTESTAVALPASVMASLSTGADYFWRVEALLPDLSTATTPVRRFDVRER